MAKKGARDPLLYIQQPGIKKAPEATMQSHYMTPKRQNKIDSGKVKKHPFTRNYFTHKQELHDEAGQESQRTETNESWDDSQQVETSEEDQVNKKKFRDMDLKERLDYFLTAPDHVPIMRAEVRTEAQNYRGKIVDYQDDTVYMRVGRRTRLSEIPFDAITEIRLIGF